MQQRVVILFVLMGSYLGFCLAFPLFPTLFLNENYNFLPKDCSLAMRNILLGLTYTTYYIGSFIGTPFIGKLSDHFGRKSILSVTLLLVALTYILSAFAIQFSSLAFLLFARFFTGFFDGSYSLAYTVLIDMDKSSNEKLNNIEFWTTMVSNGGWIAGSFIGWTLIANSSLSLTLLSIPFWIAFFIYFSCFLLVFFFLKESHPVSPSNFDLQENPFFSVLTSFKHSSLRPVLISNTTFYIATVIFAFYIPVFLMKEYHFEAQKLGTVESYLSISSCLAPFTYWLYSRYCSRKSTMCISAIGTAISLLLLLTLSFKGSLWFFLFLISYFSALGFSFSTFLVIDYSSSERRGETLGVNQALFVLIEAVASFLCGLFAAIWLCLPLLVAVACSLFSACWIFSRLLSPSNTRSLSLHLQK